jgi:hypothetical protein
MKSILVACGCAALVVGTASAQTFTIPERIDRLSAKASDSVNITLDGPLLQLAAGFLNSAQGEEQAAKDIISNLKSIHVRNFEFEKSGEYTDADLEAVRAQLKPPAWARMISTSDANGRGRTEIYVKQAKEGLAGFVILAAEQRELSIVSIDGRIDLKRLASLGGKFGIPKVPAPPAPPAPPPAPGR